MGVGMLRHPQGFHPAPGGFWKSKNGINRPKEELSPKTILARSSLSRPNPTSRRREGWGSRKHPLGREGGSDTLKVPNPPQKRRGDAGVDTFVTIY